LLADDDALSRKLLGAALERSGFEVHLAEDGEKTLQLIATAKPDLLVLDFEMPGLDGAQVCQQLRSSDRDDWRTLPVIMLTAHAGEAEEINCLQAGANDFVTKPVSREALAARIQTHLRLRALSDELRQQNEVLARWRVAQEADLAAAQATQRALIPATPPALAGWSVQTIYQPVIQVGGDVFGWRSVGEGRWMFWLADATGHGAAAALFTALAAQLFHEACEGETEPAGVLDCVNQAFRRVFDGRVFMSACCAVIDPHGSLSFCSAGHPPLLVRRADGHTESFGPHTTILGLQGESAPEQSQLTLASDDVALLYTDGLFALKRSDGERFGNDAVQASLPKIAPGPAFIERLLQHLRGNSNGEPCEDDVAAIALLKL
jgi:sigma-B regulation protein RsbU (phosphoserine phosphatase)